MNLEKLQALAAADITEFTFHGIPLRIRKIGAMDGIALHKIIPDGALTASGEVSDPALLADFYAFAISKSLVDEHGNLDTDSDAGRAELAKLPFAHLVALSEACLAISRVAAPIADAKKNESGQSLTASRSDSALPSESSTPSG